TGGRADPPYFGTVLPPRISPPSHHDEVLQAADLADRSRHLRSDTRRQRGKRSRRRFIRQQPIAKSADGQMCNRGESPTVMGVDDEARGRVGLVRNDRLVKKCGEGQIRESILRRDLFLAGLSRNAGQLVAAARRRGLGEERPEIAERITAISDR